MRKSQNYRRIWNASRALFSRLKNLSFRLRQAQMAKIGNNVAFTVVGLVLFELAGWILFHLSLTNYFALQFSPSSVHRTWLFLMSLSIVLGSWTIGGVVFLLLGRIRRWLVLYSSSSR